MKNHYFFFKDYVNYHNEIWNKIIKMKSDSLKISKQFNLAIYTLKKMGINLNENYIRFDLSSSKNKVSVGCVIDVSIPNKILLSIKPYIHLGAFSVLMHEMGHALYFSNIKQNIYELNKSYNSIFDEGMALFFQKIVLSKEWFEHILEMEYPLSYNLAFFEKPIFMCAISFENEIYENSDTDFDEIWEKYENKYFCAGLSHWTKEHFFVSNPGYYIPYLLGDFLADSLINFFNNKYNSVFCDKVGSFLKNKIWSKGRLLKYDKLLQKIKF